MDEGEEKINALQRECKEEIGCDIEIIDEVGSIVEYRKMFYIKQTSYCYLAKVKGEKGLPNFMDNEIEDGFKEVWLSYEDAEHALMENKAIGYEGSAYIVPRDIIFLQEVKNKI